LPKDRKAGTDPKSGRSPLPERLQVTKFKLRYKNGTVRSGSEKIGTQTEKEKSEKALNLIRQPLLLQAIDRAILFYTSRTEPSKAEDFRELRNEILEAAR